MKLYVVAVMTGARPLALCDKLQIESTHHTKKAAHARGKALRAEGVDAYVYEAAAFERLTGVKP